MISTTYGPLPMNAKNFVLLGTQQEGPMFLAPQLRQHGNHGIAIPVYDVAFNNSNYAVHDPETNEFQRLEVMG